jgi:hypothetical protein
VAAEVSIHDRDVWTPDLLQIDREQIAGSIEAELDVESRWRAYLDPGSGGVFRRAEMVARRTHRLRRFLPRGAPLDDGHPGVRMVRRLVNIELAHMDLLRVARDSAARWSLILEDDAVGDPVEVARTLRDVMAGAGDSAVPKYVNVSRSFEERRLGVEHLLSDLGPVSDSSAVHALASQRPVTNTVCAILYRRTFLEALVPALEAIPVSPVVPIDWKLNEALMTLHHSGTVSSGDCWLLRPAPIVQASMHG